MSAKKTAIVVGTGAGGAMAAKELQKEFQVTILEAGKEFKPFSYPVDFLAGFRRTGLFFDEKMISLLLPSMIIDHTEDMVVVSGRCIGGTTTLATGNAVRCDEKLKELGIDLDREFQELYSELPITTDHQKHWNKTTRDMYSVFEEMGLDPVVTPKLMKAEQCTACGHCAIGCPTGAKWDTRELVREAVENGAELISGCEVTDVLIEDGIAKAVHAKYRGRKVTYTADVIVLAAGGLNTPVILEKSDIPVQKTLFVDPVLCVAGELEGIRQDRQVLMPFISQQNGYILSPYMDYLSYFFNKDWYRPMQSFASIMIKLADEETGYTDGKRVEKKMSVQDHRTMGKAVSLSREILERMGVPASKQVLGTLNAGHPGGMMPLNREQKDTLHDSSLPANLYVADATILPGSLGNPPILTIMALAKKISGIIRNA